MTEGFIRQRRNLITSDILILLLAIADVSIDQLSLVGVQFSAFGNPAAILLFLWIAWGYFLYRYTIYFSEEAPAVLSKVWIRDFESIVGRRIKKLVYQEYKEPNDGCGYSYWMLRQNRFLYNGQRYDVRLNENGQEERQTYNFTLLVPRIKVLPWEILAAIRYVTLSPPVTDYLLAFALSAGVFVYCGFFRVWDGNFFVLLAHD